jgi:beta-glucanase (GH16 family)
MELTFSDHFYEKSWGNNEEGFQWIVGEGWGVFHPDKPNVWYGPPQTTKEPYGNAKFTAKYNPKTFSDDGKTGNPITIPFEVSLLSSCVSFKQQYGRFECRCTIPHDRGVWPAFWLWGSTWPPEIDVFELWGGKDGKRAGIQKPDLHYGVVEDGTKGSIPRNPVRVERKDENKHWSQYFHEFAVEWTPTKIKFITDGVTIMRFTGKKELEWFNKDTAKMWMVINHSIEEAMVDSNEENYYSEFLVDYIRAYQWK